jgi:branched-chain amino acid transport system substrate-binding protein
MKKITWLIVIAVIVIIGFLMIGSPTETVGRPIKIGFMGPLSGEAVIYGESTKKAVELAVKEKKLANIELIFEDSKCEGKEAINAINKLIAIDGVSAIIGEFCPEATLAAAPTANQNSVVLISSGSGDMRISNAGEYIYRTIPPNTAQAKLTAQLMNDQGLTKIALLYSDEKYGIGLSDELTQEIEKQGGEIVARESFDQGDTDLEGQLSEIKDADPDAIYLATDSIDSAIAAINQIEKNNIKAALYGAEGVRSNEILDATKGAAEGLIITALDTGTTIFKETYKKEYDEIPGPFAAQSYDAFNALAMAIEDGARTGQEIKDVLQKIEFNGASGHIVFDKNGDVPGNFDVLVVMNGKFIDASTGGSLKEVEDKKDEKERQERDENENDE